MHWTYSRLSDFEKCPALYEARYKARWPDYVVPPAPALERGNKLHELMERAVITGKKLVGALARYNDYVAELREWPIVRVEEEIALDKTWAGVGYRAHAMWWRGKMDVMCLGHDNKGKVVDWKSGGIYGTNADQVRLYAGVMFERHPGIDECEVELVYLDQKKSIAETITRADWPAKKSEFTAAATRMLTARSFPTKPGSYCSYCAFGPNKGGPCPAGVRNREGLQTDSTRARLVTHQAAPLHGRLARQDFGAPPAPAGVRGAKKGQRPA